MSLKTLVQQIMQRQRMQQELDTLRGSSQVFDRTGNLSLQIADRENAIRAKYNAPAQQASPFAQISNPGTADIALALSNLRQQPTTPVSPAMPSLQSQTVEQPVAQSTPAVPEIGLVNRAMRRPNVASQPVDFESIRNKFRGMR